MREGFGAQNLDLPPGWEVSQFPNGRKNITA